MARMSAREIDSAFASDYTEQDAQQEYDLRFEEADEDCFEPVYDEREEDWLFQDDYYPPEDPFFDAYDYDYPEPN
ncbi:hypothetical protein D3C85_569070 [compost metagenome]